MSKLLDNLKKQYDFWIETVANDGRILVCLCTIDINDKLHITVRSEEGYHIKKPLTDEELDNCERTARFVARSKGLY